MSVSNDREFDMLVDELLKDSKRDPERYPDDPEWTDEYWRKRAGHLMQRAYRRGARAMLDKRYYIGQGEVVTDRVQWLADHDFLTADVRQLLDEAVRLRELEDALRGSYGVTDSDIRSMLSEGFHTAWRKAVDHPYATVIHKLIRDLPEGEYGAVVDFVADPLIAMLRRAQEKQAAEQE
jgi:hypothetical protein